MKKWLAAVFKNRKVNSGVEGDFQPGESAESVKNESEMKTVEEFWDGLEDTQDDSSIRDDGQTKKTKNPKPKKRWSIRKRVIVFSCIGIVAALFIAIGVWALTIISDPLAQFQPNNNNTGNTVAAQQGTTGSKEESPSATVDPEDLLLSEADLSILHDKFTNIMLIGVDQSEERESDEWNGKTDFHADVMIVLTINNETGEVSMISLPRDTYAKIPGVGGIYKLNASINCGGGWCDDGFKKVCQAAQWMLGGSGGEDDPILINYYFAVDMNAVKDLVDEIGGVDYNLDISFSMQGRSYQKGQQHMDGQAVLDYLRVRKEASGGTEGIDPADADGETGDKNRVNRQKNMLIAIFKKIKDNGLLFSIPSLIDAFDGNLAYNLSVSQIAGLAYYALSVDPDTIKMYSMSGSYVTVITADSFNYPLAFAFTNQSNRVEIINEVYGIDVSRRSGYTLNSLRLLWGKLESRQYTNVVEPILDKVKAKLDADALLPAEPTPTPTPEPSESPSPSESEGPSDTSGFSEASESVSATGTFPTESVAPVSLVRTESTGYQQYSEEDRAFYNLVLSEYKQAEDYSEFTSGEDLLNLLAKLREDTLILCDMFNISKPDDSKWYYDFVNKYNDVFVDMR